jgi:uncharacterized GH25 family protein
MRRALHSRTMRRLAATALTFVFGVASVSAHDMWIEPTTFTPETGEIVGARLRVGQDFLGDPLARDTSLINEFVFADTSGRRPLVGRDGGDPAGFQRVAQPGLVVIGYRSRPSAVQLPAERFEQYLKEEGLDSIAKVRAARGESGTSAREVFMRCAKSLLWSGSITSGPADRRLGFPLELVAERNPYASRDDENLPVRLTYEGRPLQGALVVAMNHANPSHRISARSDADGRVRLRLRPGGMWLVKAVHMIPAPPGSGAQWASFWASLTFELRANGVPRS